MRAFLLMLIGLSLLGPAAAKDVVKPPAEKVTRTDWGDIVHIGETRKTLNIKQWPADGNLALPTPFPNIVRAWRDQQETLSWSFNQDATEITLHLPASKTDNPTIHLQTAERSSERVFSALDSRVVGSRAKLESHPGNHRIGFWSNASDRVQWDRAVPAGHYRIELVYSAAGPDGTQVRIALGSQAVNLSLKSTGSWYRYVVLSAGSLKLAKESSPVTVSCVKKVGGAVMNLKAVLLHPVDP